ncbi:hypothetical protein BGX30_002158 [Mortierella sp. GBA39]|nr:hypothetical protein BGX30_002158 [Mortierella sp. GBA39]
MKILVSGFEPFGGNAVNPTEQLVRDIREETFAETEIRTVLLPVHYDECAERLLEAVRDYQPDAVICCGLAAGRTAVTPERIAVNVKDVAPEAAYADNKGERPQDLPINPAGPDGLFSRLPIREAVNRLKAEGIPAAVSESAGTFICNNTMYAVLDYIRPVLPQFAKGAVSEYDPAGFPYDRYRMAGGIRIRAGRPDGRLPAEADRLIRR